MRNLSILLFFLVLSIVSYAQNRTVSGTIKDEKGNPVAGATIVVKGTKIVTTANAEGQFSFSVPVASKVLTVSSVGFATSDFTVSANNSVMAVLKTSTESLDEVVVVGYGTARKKSDLVGSIVQVSGDKLVDRPVANVLDALQGRAAGVQIYNSTGEPSAVPSIRINGVGSLGASSTPLFVMDGIPVDPTTTLTLNPEDIESLSVLRDAASTSIYGSRAANGVILITTKKGKANNSKISIQTQYSISNLLSNTVNMHEGFMNTKELTDFWIATGYRTQAQVNTLLSQYNADTKWYKTYYKENVPTFQTDLNISGGGGKTTYYVSGSYFKQDGLAYRSKYERYTLRSNVQSNVNNWMQLGVNLFGSFDNRQVNPYGTNQLNRGLAPLSQPFYSPNDANGVPYPNLIPGLNRYNPAYLATNITEDVNNVQLNPSGYIQLTPITGMTLKSQAGIEFFDRRTTALRLPSYLGSLNNGSAQEIFRRFSTKTITNTGEYKFNIANKHNFSVLAGQEFIYNSDFTFNGSSTGQTDDRLLLISSGSSNFNAGSGKSEYSYLSYFGRLGYNLNSKYYLDASIRRDESSRFGRDLRGATFWAVGGTWQAKKEKFLSDINWLTDLSVKASLGTSGNSAIGNYDALATVGSGLYNGQTAWGITNPGNPLLSWESQKQFNLGFQARLFNKLNVEAEFFDRRTSNMIIDVPYPLTSGFDQITTNVGSLKNTGINFSINYDLINKRDGYLNLYVNAGLVQQKITDLFQGKNYWIIPNTGVSWAVGQPVSYFYPIFYQVNPQTGMPEWYKPNADPNQIVTPNRDDKNVTTVFNTAVLQQNTGIKRYAPLNGGFGLSGGFKQFSIQMDFAFSKGKYMINNDRYFFENPNVFAGFNQSRTVLDYWKNPGDRTTFPAYSSQFTQFDSRLIEDASFMRLKNLTIAYSVSKKVLDKTRFIKGAKFFVTFRNIWTITKYRGPDPEVDTNVTLGANPNTKQTSFGINFDF